MASPQLANGFAQIANEVLDALARYPFNGRQRAILDIIIRKTWGDCERNPDGSYKRDPQGNVIHKKSARIALSIFAADSGISSSHACDTLKGLVKLNVISKSLDETTGHTIYSFQKDYDQWLIPRRTPSMKATSNGAVPENGNFPKSGTIPEIGNLDFPTTGIMIPNNGNRDFPKTGDTKEVSNKKVISSKKGSCQTDQSSASSDHHQAIAFWCTQYETAMNHKYRFAGPGEGAMIKTLLHRFEIDTLKKMMLALIHTDDNFVREKRGITIKTLLNDAMLLAQKVEGPIHVRTNRQHNAVAATPGKYAESDFD